MFFFLLDPACQNINTKLKCYVSDPLCADHPSLDIANIVYASLILGGSVFFFVVCFLLCKKCKRNHRNRGRRKYIIVTHKSDHFM